MSKKQIAELAPSTAVFLFFFPPESSLDKKKKAATN